MAQRYSFRQEELCSEQQNSCYAPLPDFDDCYNPCTPCENPCEPKCPPKVRAKDAICLSDEEYERCFSLHRFVGCAPTQVPAFVYCIALKVRRQGMCRVLTEECPVRADAHGNACFVWSDKFRDLPAGYYEADLYLNGKSCFTLLFRKRDCWATAKTESVRTAEQPCSPPEHCCVGCTPQPDFDDDTRLGDCDGNQCK